MSFFAEIMLKFEIEPAEARLVDGESILTEKGMLQAIMRGAIKGRFDDVSEGVQTHAADAVACAQLHHRDLGEAVKYLHVYQPSTPIDLTHRLVNTAERLELMRFTNDGFDAEEVGVDERGTPIYIKVD